MNHQFTPELSIIIPLYNEEKVFRKLTERIDNMLNTLNFEVEVVLIDDGSLDQTASLIREKCLSDSKYQGILLSRNHGHQLALTAGLAHSLGSKAVMVMDGDLQYLLTLLIFIINSKKGMTWCMQSEEIEKKIYLNELHIGRIIVFKNQLATLLYQLIAGILG